MHITMTEAVGRRLRRNYGWLFGIQVVAYIGKLIIHPFPIDSPAEFLSRAAVGPIPGWLICSAASPSTVPGWPWPTSRSAAAAAPPARARSGRPRTGCWRWPPGAGDAKDGRRDARSAARHYQIAENTLHCERVHLRYATRNRFAHIQTATRDQLTAKARQFVDIVENICLELRRIHVLYTENISRGPGNLSRSH